MFALVFAAALGLTADDVLARIELYSVSADGSRCVLVPEADRPVFRSWRVDAERTEERQGIYGLYNPRSPEQLVLFFGDERTCAEALDLWVEREPLELGRDRPDSASQGPVELRGNPRDIDPERALDDAARLGVFPDRSLWCACEIDRTTMSCGEDGSPSDVAHAPVVPIREFGPTFAAWREGDPACTRRGRTFSGRRCAAQVDSTFRRMVADLYNLAPQEIRSSYMERDLRAPLPERCESDPRRSRLRPAKMHRGIIARIYLYMAKTYPDHVSIEPALNNLLERWNREAPPSKAECDHAAEVAALQGNVNPVVRSACGR